MMNFIIWLNFYHQIQILFKCNDYSKNKPSLYINVYYSEYKDDYYYQLFDSPIDLPLTFNLDKVTIDLDLLLDEMPEKSLNFFKLKNEIYNIDKIEIEPINITPLDKVFDFTNITIDGYIRQESYYDYFKRGDLSEENTVNHGILFDYPLKMERKMDDLINFPFNL